MAALTPKQEKFAQCIAKGMNQSDAYRECYNFGAMSNNSINRKAHEVMSNGNVAARVKELGKPAVEAVELTVQKVLLDIQTIKKNSMELKEDGAIRNAKAALHACELEGKHLKMFTDQMLVGGNGVPIEIEVRFIKPGNL